MIHNKFNEVQNSRCGPHMSHTKRLALIIPITYVQKISVSSIRYIQNSPPLPLALPTAAALQIPTRPHHPTLHPLQSPCTPCPLRIVCTGRFAWPATVPLVVAALASTVSPSSRTMCHIVLTTPVYGPTSTTVWTPDSCSGASWCDRVLLLDLRCVVRGV